VKKLSMMVTEERKRVEIKYVFDWSLVMDARLTNFFCP
jgi:hypothetical protein